MAIKNSRTISKKSIIFCTTTCQSKRTRGMKKEQATEEIADRHSKVDYRRD
jgi:hypothetical protein